VRAVLYKKWININSFKLSGTNHTFALAKTLVALVNIKCKYAFPSLISVSSNVTNLAHIEENNSAEETRQMQRFSPSLLFPSFIRLGRVAQWAD